MRGERWLKCYIVVLFIVYCLGSLGGLEQRKNPLIYSFTVNAFTIAQKNPHVVKSVRIFSLIV